MVTEVDISKMGYRVGAHLRALAASTLMIFANAGQGTIQHPSERFELRGRTTVASAVESYKKTLSEVSTLNPESKVGRCSLGGSKFAACFVDRSQSPRYLPPFPAVPPDDIDEEWNNWTLSWAPLKETMDGRKVLARWEGLAQKMSPFGCDGPSCRIVVRTLRNETEDSERALVLCETTVIGPIRGAPGKCRSVVIYESDNVWMRVVTGIESTRNDLSMSPSFTVYRTPPIAEDRVLNAAQNALAASPLKLETKLFQKSLFGASSYRTSEVLRDFREQVSVRIDVLKLPFRYGSPRNPEEWIDRSSTSLYITIFLYVNRQNTDRPEDWHQPSGEQRDMYSRAVEANLRERLESLCKSASWDDSHTLECDRPDSGRR